MNLSRLLVSIAAAASLLGPQLSPAGEPERTAGAQTVQLSVTKDGFVPDRVVVKAGKPVRLVVTRKVEITCATEIVMKDFAVNRPLPLNEAVTVTITPQKPGEYRYACGMDMVAGILKAE